MEKSDQGTFFWELRACAYWKEFEQPKFIVPAITIHLARSDCRKRLRETQVDF